MMFTRYLCFCYGGCAIPKTISIEYHPDEEDVGLLHNEAFNFQVENEIQRKTGKTNKSWKTLMDKEKHNKESKDGILGFPAGPKLRRIDLFHRLEPSGHGLGWTNPIILTHKKDDDTSCTKLRKSSQEENIPDNLAASSKEEVSGLQDPKEEASDSIRKLTKSGSFPAADSSHDKCLKPSAPEHKQKEIWSFPQAETRVSSPGSIPRRWDQLVLYRFKEIKHRIKHAFKETRKRNYPETLEGPTIGGTYMSMSLDSTTVQLDALDHDLSDGALRIMKRTNSLNESLDRYARLFQHSFVKEPVLHCSSSLRLSNEDTVLSREHVLKLFRRISSLSDRESFGLETLASEMPIQSASNFEPREAALETEFQEMLIEENSAEIAEPDDLIDDVVEPDTWGDSHDQEQKNVLSISPMRELNQSSSDSCPASPDTCAEHPNFEEINPLEDHEDDNCSDLSVSDKDDDVCSKYVRDALELSGFTENEFLGMWYLPDQPLNPSLFKELETSVEEDGRSCYHHLPFDLVNESLLKISDISATPVCFPKAFSFSPGIFQSPKWHHIMQKVTAKVARILEFKPDPNQTLDDIVSRDLAKDSWINLQVDAEFVALDLENMIFDKLLDELLYL